MESYLYKNIFSSFNLIGSAWPILVVVFFFSVVLHEVAHGYIALINGDPTAKAMGRLTLNPIVHIDLFGTILLPLILIISGSNFLIGYAKPVPINPYNFHDIKQGTIKVSLAGSLTNFSLAILFSLIIWLFNLLNFSQTDTGFFLIIILAGGAAMNIVLGLFNLVPVPPLDGSRVVSSLLPPEMAEKYDRIAPFGIFLVFLVIMVFWQLLVGIANIFYKLLFLGLPL
ncbi:MAG: site-2 protease family protein, partial [Elusimicrobiota bacterium]